MRICCVVYALSQGGAERVVTTMANHWVSLDRDVHVITLAAEAEPAFPLDGRVTIHALNVASKARGLVSALLGNFRRILALRRSIKQNTPDVVVAYMAATNILTIIACLGLDVRVVATEHAPPFHWPNWSIWNRLRLFFYPRASVVVLQSEMALDYYPENVRRKTAVLPNPIHIEADAGVVDLPAGKIVIAMGRLSEEKRFDLLLRAFSQVADSNPEWSLVILGEGGLRSGLEKLRAALGLDGKVYFPGFQPNPHTWLRKSDLFVLSSQFEGFGNVLAEALMCGLPVVSTDCPNGPREIVRDGVDGFLVENGSETGLAQSITRLMIDQELRAAFCSSAPEAAERFGVEVVMSQWEHLLCPSQKDA